MLEHLKKYQILLASNSPRRQELLTQLGISFTTFVIPGIDESFPADLADDKVAAFITRKKAQAYIDALLTDRNRIWAQKFDEYLHEGGNTFVFAGTAHFLGKSSVFEIMRQKNMLE